MNEGVGFRKTSVAIGNLVMATLGLTGLMAALFVLVNQKHNANEKQRH